VELEAVPDGSDLSAAQRIQVAAARDRRAHVDVVKLGEFLRRLEPPLRYLDFESFATAVPRLPGTRPYQQVPFQFSLFVDDGSGEEPRSIDFLAEGEGDPRPGLLTALRRAAGSSEAGTFVAYNAGFEKAQLVECAAACPEHAGWVAAVVPRFVDLLEPFRSFSFYDPGQLGSASLKAVLPVLGRRGYEGLAIDEGGLAAREYLRSLAAGTGAAERERIRAALIDYCRRDTEGMIEIVAALREIVARGGQEP